MVRTTPRKKSDGGFTLVEVMIAMMLIALMCLSVLTGLRSITDMTMGVAVRSEAYRVMQAEAERLTQIDYDSFQASGDQTTTSCLKTTFLPGNQNKFDYPANGSGGRITLTRRVVEVSSTDTTKTLRVEVRWTWQGRTNLISTLLFRAQ